MDNFKIYKFFLLLFFLSSCVPTKNLIYLQNKDKSSEEVVSSTNQKPYRFQTNDILNITIKAIDPKMVEIFNLNQSQSSVTSISEQSNYFNGYSVDDHGNIRLPMLGEINVLGFTSDEVRVKIENLLNEHYFKEEAGIFVTVKLAGFRYTINGEVGNTGTKILYQDKVNLLEAIANAGDILVTGDRKDIKVFRRFPQGVETFSIDLTDAKATNSPCYYLQPNDYIYVKPLKQKAWGTGKTGIESMSTIISVLSLTMTLIIFLRK